MGRVTDFLNATVGTKNPQQVGIGGFRLLARIREDVEYSSNVPAHVLEDGSPANDNVTLNPLRLTIEGEVSDIFVEPSAQQEAFTRTAQAPGAISIYLPERTASESQRVAEIVADAGNAIEQVDELINAGENVLDLLGGSGAQAKPLQERFIDAMEALHFGRQLISIDLPYRTHENMRIVNFTPSWDNEIDSTVFKIEALQLRFKEQAVSSVQGLINNPSSALGGQASEQVQKGAQEGTDAPSSLLNTIFGG